MAKIKADKKTLIRWKVYVDRARMYIGYVQFLMIVFVLLKSYKDSMVGRLIFDNMMIALPIIFIVFILLSLIVGRIDTLLGLREEEMRNASRSNPVTREIQKNLEEIKEELKSLKSEINKKD